MHLKFVFLMVQLVFFSSVISKEISNETQLEVVYQWKYVDFEFDSQERRETVFYNTSNIIILNFYLVKDGRTFVTLNKNENSPVSLSTVSKIQAPNGPLLKPYPDWEWHLRTDCIGIYGATMVQVDSCNRLYVLDNGNNDAGKLICPPQILIFDLKSNKLISRYPIPMKYATGGDGKGRLLNMIVDSSGWRCKKSKIYMSYMHSSSGFLVWNGRKFWRILGPDPDDIKGGMVIAGKFVNTGSTIYGFALSPKIANYPQFIAFTSLASYDVFTVTIDEILASEPRTGVVKWLVSPIVNIFRKTRSQENDTIIEFKSHFDILPSTAAAFAFDSNGILYAGINTYVSLGCVNTTMGIRRFNFDIIDEDGDKLRFVAGAYVYNSSITNGEEELWILTNKYVDYVYEDLDFSEINYRIMKQRTKQLTADSRCAQNNF